MESGKSTEVKTKTTIGVKANAGEQQTDNKSKSEVLETEIATVNEVYSGLEKGTATESEIQLITIYKNSSQKLVNKNLVKHASSKLITKATDDLQTGQKGKAKINQEGQKTINVDIDLPPLNYSDSSIPSVIKVPLFNLNSGFRMPMVGFGTYHLLEQKEIALALDWAFRAGYRLIDTAPSYKNEVQIARALKILLPRHGLSRGDIFITSKLEPKDHDDGVKSGLVQSLANLDTYIDLYLVHWPGAIDNAKSPYNFQLRARTWAAMVEAYNLGYVRSIGVSNYSLKHLKQLLKNSYDVKPCVNQIEWHPYWHDAKMRDLCRQHGILIQGYYSLGGPKRKKLIKDKKIKQMAKCLNVSPEQLLLRWSLQKNVAVIPRGRTKEQIENNIQLNFEICCGCMKYMDQLPQQKLGADPTIVY